MSDLIYPTLDLFIYALKTPLNATHEEIQKNKIAFLSQLPDGTQIEDSDSETEHSKLTKPAQIDFKSNDEELEGYYYPVRLNDTYGLQIDCSVKNQTDPQPAKCFKTLKTEIDSRHHKELAVIGQTWLLSGYLSKDLFQNPEDIAQDCYYALFEDNNYQQKSSGTFLGSSIFEFLGSRNLDRNESSDRHVVIAIYSNRESAEKAAEFYSDWMGLFCYRNKITWAYRQSRLVKESLIKHYGKIEEIRKIIHQSNYWQKKHNFAGSRKILNNISDTLQQYTIDLLKLSFQKQVIEINLSNYQTRLNFIQEKADRNDRLDFLEKFSDLAIKKDLLQLTKDIENMQLGLQLLKDTSNAIRSRVEVEKSERDRNFQEFVAVVGAGVATVSLLKEPVKDCKDIFSKTDICNYPFSFSLAIGVLVGFGFWLLRKRLL
ncbi:MAG: hypothetical protein CLLPBCKN_004339 [Chroococcidiopsis cubana SAG 39.79]|uniref:Uncharacterized protein n=1 Tax=Chroococcidiopsis cubana SAG 39.79 TaxID=388085 RepID=A0AB37ULV1_9CYAN|nr:hypothetical protein [Chroococcidiopsis cubana]MDZ4874943.1 hypothetical protein [Chroococcidiopsis cubana SAG 39.79]PSB65389.1 hypothetical protein C7B79_05650 [Chroococcidiopsis cubana CCALA 043]RUT12351.1 hypothetical protein DSM107010_23610 [Chroococcidiopsis cubana SAG 39.79]